jgi:hypothetical protein
MARRSDYVVGKSQIPLEEIMKIVLAGITALMLTSGVAMAQSATESTTTTTQDVAPPPPPPPTGVLSTTHEVHARDAYGDSKDAKSTTYRDDNGVSRESQSTTTRVAPPAPPPVTSSTSTSSTSSTTVPQ